MSHAHQFAVAEDRLVVQQDRFGIVHQEMYQASAQTFLLVLFQRLAANKVGVLLERDGEAQARLERRVGGGNIVPPMAIRFFAAQRIERMVAGEAKPQIGALGDQKIEHRAGEFGRQIELHPSSPT